eukprot:TRINITY_DN30513_c0_g1_i1.p1 TRINITY_DN30513_c0_g1~~TRINITY_DN30513_c0_g1_i1.p1  ORF type:complete len:618 (+),score=83.91 TRINITY_DN30513_c0_g1_i1:41-1894(+)
MLILLALAARLLVLQPGQATRPVRDDTVDDSLLETEETGRSPPEFSLAYRLFDGLTMQVSFCKVTSSKLQSANWNLVEETLPWLDIDPDRSVWEYSYVPGTAFVSGSSEEAGWCYRQRGSDTTDLLCVCGSFALDGDQFAGFIASEQVQDYVHFAACKAPQVLPDNVKAEPLKLTIGQFETRAKWAHPLSLWLETETKTNQWCEMVLSPTHSFDKAVSHALPYCAVIKYQEENTQELYGNTLEFVKYYLYWAMSWDERNPTGWFKVKRMSIARYFRELRDSLNRGPHKFGGGERRKVKGASEEVLKHGSKLCDVLEREAPKMFELLLNTYTTYMGSVKKVEAPPKNRTPLIVFAGGPPSSGKSITSMSSWDYKLIQDMTAGSGSETESALLKGRTYENFQKNTVELNVDRIVESSSLMRDFKTHMIDREEWATAIQNGKEIAKMNEIKTGDAQREYFFLRKAVGIDDLSNAHIQRQLALGNDVIYETLIGDGWLVWAEKFELPKIKAAGYLTLLIDYVVPVSELVSRAIAREKATGQTAAPAKQIESDAIAAPTNFMKPNLLNLIDYGVAMSHVRRNATEDALAVYRKGCFTHCADDAMLDNYDVSILRLFKLQNCN